MVEADILHFGTLSTVAQIHCCRDRPVAREAAEIAGVAAAGRVEVTLSLEHILVWEVVIVQ